MTQDSTADWQARPRVSLRLVAQAAGVSIATASRVLNDGPDKASAETVLRVREAAERLGYRPGGAAQALRRRESRIVAVLAAALINPVMATIVASIGHALRAEGLVMALCDTHEDAAIQDDFLTEMQAQNARAFVLVGAVDSPGLTRLRAAGAPLIFVNRPDPGPAPGGAYVGIDNAAAGEALARHVLALGTQRAILLHGSLERTAGTERARGIRAAFAAVPDAELIAVEAPGLDQLTGGLQAMAQVLSLRDPPRAVLCLSDALAYGAWRGAREAGRQEGFDLYGFDNLLFNDWVAPWLSSVAVDPAAFGPAVLAQLPAPRAGSRCFLPHRLHLRPG
ncbi:LacI family transcriptional regulator [Pseudooceanicola sp. CBS1P-1]|uniref:Substrate-binding domain-containing protein n=1 Tax=Pseudooceanicola albus TaxID=2692189 RepID=A0A6L7G768_9RHOB|nr:MULTISPECIES: LacI family DNA-binding transcriptional regulator [Pseudooceanicola]MBT9386197.1 LacI family transcriptional regulator [Pseudooceanicola endophyticus]MXN19388.1 substrate-binding domain-containing protein [Pseudooceanicola albus]